MGRQKFDRELNTLRGKRLKECRKHRNLTQAQFAEKVNNSTNYISMLENGKRLINWDRAVEYGEILNVNPLYIMCKSDHIEKKKEFEKLKYGKTEDFLFLQYLSLTYDIKFYVERISNKGKSDTICVGIDELDELSITDPIYCKLVEDDITYEAIIVSVEVDGIEMPYWWFAFTIVNLGKYIRSTFDNMKETLELHDLCLTMDNYTRHKLENIHDEKTQ